MYVKQFGMGEHRRGMESFSRQEGEIGNGGQGNGEMKIEVEEGGG
jgi:hypothetical protein